MLGALLVVGALSVVGVASQRGGQMTVEVERLEDNLFVLRGGGGNSAAFVTSAGVVLVDTKLAGWGQPLIDKIGELTSNPITTIINTHAHFDHVDGNVEFPASVEFVAHENTQRLMRENNAVRGLGRPARPSPFNGDNALGIPERTFTDTLSLGSGSDRVELHYFGRAHTGGDTWVVFPALRVMHAGDAFPGKQIPIMDSNNGGSGVDYPDTLRKASVGITGVDGTTSVDRIITGHSTVMTPADLAEYAEFVGVFRDAVRAAKAAGTSAADFAAGWEVPTRFSGYNGAPAERLQIYVQDMYDALP
jgi:glyoxylase-like metal-dependent hydrolase (beta-lactamase superfamily II)